jgi:hypothetical protein
LRGNYWPALFSLASQREACSECDVAEQRKSIPLVEQDNRPIGFFLLEKTPFSFYRFQFCKYLISAGHGVFFHVM